jgi:ribosome modulation factor
MARKQKTSPDAPGAGHNSGEDNEAGERVVGRTTDEMRVLFNSHRSAWTGWKAKLAVVEEIERDVKAALKADGFTVKQMQIADSLLTVKGEEKITNEVQDRLQVALWVGHPMGRQLEMFQDPDRTPAVDRAFEDGKTAGLEGRVRKPPYSPELPQHEQWMQGWYAGNKIMLDNGGGFKGAPSH